MSDKETKTEVDCKLPEAKRSQDYRQSEIDKSEDGKGKSWLPMPYRCQWETAQPVDFAGRQNTWQMFGDRRLWNTMVFTRLTVERLDELIGRMDELIAILGGEGGDDGKSSNGRGPGRPRKTSS